MTLFIENYGLLIHYTTHLHILNHFDDNYNRNLTCLNKSEAAIQKWLPRFVILSS